MVHIYELAHTYKCIHLKERRAYENVRASGIAQVARRVGVRDSDGGRSVAEAVAAVAATGRAHTTLNFYSHQVYRPG